MAGNDSADGEVSSAQAVLLGALAPGVNGPTWTTLKSTFLMLGLCLVLMLGLAFSSSDSWLILHVTFLVVITATLFLLLNWFLSQTGLVSVKNQMEELQLAPKSQDKSEKKRMIHYYSYNIINQDIKLDDICLGRFEQTDRNRNHDTYSSRNTR